MRRDAIDGRWGWWSNGSLWREGDRCGEGERKKPAKVERERESGWCLRGKWLRKKKRKKRNNSCSAATQVACFTLSHSP